MKKKTNKVKVVFEMTATQKIDLIKALNHIKAQGAMDDGRALQLLAINYLIEAQHEKRN